jgi:hypothetical protein
MDVIQIHGVVNIEGLSVINSTFVNQNIISDFE